MALLFRHPLLAASLLFALAASFACGPTAPRYRAARGEAQQEDSAVGPGDVFDVRVYDEEDLSAQYRVENDGTIDFPLIGRVAVAGLDATAIATRIRDQLREGQFLVAPHVSVRVQEYNSRRVSVIGAVREPGSYPISSRMGVVEAVSLAGGFTALANRDGTLLTRRVDGELHTFSVPVDRISSGQEPDVTVRAGDILHVPERLFGRASGAAATRASHRREHGCATGSKPAGRPTRNAELTPRIRRGTRVQGVAGTRPVKGRRRRNPMSEPLTSATLSTPASQPRALRILAKSTFRELKSSGYSRSEILAFATEMLSLVSSDLRDQSVDAAAEE